MRCILAMAVAFTFIMMEGTPMAAAETRVFVTDAEKISGGYQFTEGPLWHPEGFLLFTDIPANTIYRLTPGEKGTIWRKPSGNANGLTFDLEGRFLACEHGNRRVSVTADDGVIAPLAETWQGKRFNSPNDVVVRSDGVVFFTDPPYGLGDRPREIDFQGVFRVTPGDDPVCLAQDFGMPNGLAFSPDETVLYIADTQHNHVRAFPVDADGSLGKGVVLGDMGTPDGMKVDNAGRVFVTSSEGIVVLAPDGRRVAVLPCPEVPANCAFGDADLKSLYITARTSIYRVRVTQPGIVPGANRDKPSQGQ